MYVIKNAVKNIWRNKGRNLLVGVIILGIITSVVVAFTINTTTGEIIKDYKAKFGSEVTISPDMDKIINGEGEKDKGGMVKIPNITADQFKAFGESDYLQKALFTSQLGATSDKLKAIDEDIEKDNEKNGSAMIMESSDNSGKKIESPKYRIIGNSSSESLTEFKDGKRNIVDGRLYESKNECIISKELADKNKIKISDYINLKNPTEDGNQTYKLKVVGIYSDGTNPYNEGFYKSAYMNRRNEILCNFETATGMSNDEYTNIQAKYFLKSPDKVKDFEAEVRSKGLPEIYNVSTDEDSYNRIVGPVEGLGSITLMFIFVVLGLGAVILILLNTLSIRERKYEVGVLRAIGMKKWKVAMGLITESLVITAICLGIGLSAGSIISQPVSNSLLQKQIEAQKESKNPSNVAMSIVSIDGEQKEDTITNIKVKMDGETLLKVTAVAMLLVLISSSAGVMYITKYEPRKILTERN
ncbi:ABC transporter permease [Clostridium sp.]|uniref:ABC transporter permease n=1 Tax=Clostridium sp. TaxID=1506 RepID=UPI002FC6C773